MWRVLTARLLLMFMAVPNWAFLNDGSFVYEDNESSWYSNMETVRAVEGMDIDIGPVRQEADIFTEKCIVAVVDTGVDIDHPALASGLWKNEDEIAGDGIDNDGNGFIDDTDGWNFYKETNVVYNSRSSTEDAHGTHCAGTIIADDEGNTGSAGVEGGSEVAIEGVRGIAGGIDAVQVMPVKTVGGPDQAGSVEDLIRGIRYAEELYQVMKESDMLFVTAAGNGESFSHGAGFDLNEVHRYPSCYGLDNVIVVANLKCDGTLHYSSNYSDVYVDLAAPGTQINGTSTHRSGYEIMTGTSMAAPMVSGAAALVFARHSDWSAAQVKRAILNSARKLDSLDGLVRTGGTLDVAAAVDYTGTAAPGDYRTPAPTDTPAPTQAVVTSAPVASAGPEGGQSSTDAPVTGGEPGDAPSSTAAPVASGEPDDSPSSTEAPVASGEPGDAPSSTDAPVASGEPADSPSSTDPSADPPTDEVRVPETTLTDDSDVSLKKSEIASVISRNKKQITVKWKKVKGADGYEIACAADKSFTEKFFIKKLAKPNKTSLTLKNLKEGGTWYVKIRAYAEKGTKRYVGKYSATHSIQLKKRTDGVKELYVKPEGKKLTVEFSKVKGATGYEVSVSTDKAAKNVKVKKRTKKTKVLFKKLQRNKKYYVTVWAYRKMKNGSCLYSDKKVLRARTR